MRRRVFQYFNTHQRGIDGYAEPGESTLPKMVEVYFAVVPYSYVHLSHISGYFGDDTYVKARSQEPGVRSQNNTIEGEPPSPRLPPSY